MYAFLRQIFVALVLFVLSAIGTLAHAQTSRDAKFATIQVPNGGAKIRIRTRDGQRLIGSVESSNNGVLAIAMNGGTRTIPIDSLVRVETIAGRRGHLNEGAVIGSAIGGLAAFFAADAADTLITFFCGDGELLCEHTVHLRGPAAVGGALSGLMVGGFIGAFIRTDKWQPFSRVAVHAYPVERGRYAIGATLPVGRRPRTR